ncbi:nucleotidyltransferase domain-containing protein [Rhodococcus erythropolis]|uniref:nucleotidyltransferase domain-containing protein n=1 Tax=Rhodococcus erythropolis TaxID=1833 RepID=UPI0024BA6EA4|nr:nucleotidyltransferase domain-containing protein [Rhodococcus erythropolis]MDJ0404002.1 nucleotidyltransferase domain-containing protein [Rhodococcus erythropolis]
MAEPPHGSVLYKVITGSHAYGMAHAGSDVDRHGIYAYPSVELWDLYPPNQDLLTYKTAPPDLTVHEIGKFLRHALASNPTVNEMLWIDRKFLEKCNGFGNELRDIRSTFLSAQPVRDAFHGYARSQFYRLQRSGRFGNVPIGREEKNARHLLRLLIQGYRLYSTGHLEVTVENSDYLFEMGRRIVADPSIGARLVAEYADRFEATTSALPAQPDTGPARDLLTRIRAHYYHHHQEHQTA